MINSLSSNSTSRYVLGGQSSIENNKLSWWDKKTLPYSDSDIEYYLEKKYESRPDVISHVFYNDTRYWWLICQYNNIIDPIQELKEGLYLRIPSIDRLKR